MAQVLVRNLDDDIHRKLRAMAERHGESLEALVRDLLRRAVFEQSREDKPLGTALAERFAACGLNEGETIPEFKGEAVRVVEFD